jgi:hypothetical protein
VLRAKRDELEEAQKVAGITDEQAEYLAQYGIGKNGYAPPSTEEKPTDFYLAKTFEIKAKGFSSLPSVKSVTEKIIAGKKLTASEALMSDAIVYLRRFNVPPDESPAKFLAMLTDSMRNNSRQLISVRSRIQRSKFAVLLGRQWFEEFQTRADNSLMVDGVQYTFEVDDNVKVEV